MARTEGLYIESVTLGGISDGGDVEFEVVTPTGDPVSAVALTVADGQTSVDLSLDDVASWPNEIRLKLNATEGDAFKSVNVRNSRGTIEFIREYVFISEPALLNMGITLTGTGHTFTWSDASPVAGRKYQIAINNITKAGTVTAPTTQWYVTGLPDDGSQITVRLTWWDNDDISTSQSVTNTVTAHTAVTGSGTQFIIPATNISEGSYNSVDFNEAIPTLSPIFWESGGDNITTVSTVGGKRALGVRLDNTAFPSTRVGAGANFAVSQKATLEQWVYFDAGFDWGGTNEGGKLGFGIGGGSRKSGGLAGPNDLDTQTGFTSRFMWRTGGSLYAYVYEANTVGYGDDYSLGVTATRATWIKLKMEVEMNSAGGVADGKLKVWVDDVLKQNVSNIEWFGQGAPSINALTLFVFHGGDDGTWTPSRVNHVYFSDIFWALDTEALPNNAPTFVSPAPGYVATSQSVNFAWAGSPGYVYDLHVYSDAARTQKVYGTDGEVFDTAGIGTATSHTFNNDPGNGAQRYVRLYWWPDNSYTNGGYIDTQYTAVSFSLSIISPTSGYTATSEDVYFEWADASKPNARYHLRVFSDPARTQLVTGTNSVPFSTNNAFTFYNYTFTDDPSDGGIRYAELNQWPDENYEDAYKIVIDFQYTAYTTPAGPPTGVRQALIDDFNADANVCSSWSTFSPDYYWNSTTQSFNSGGLIHGTAGYNAWSSMSAIYFAAQTITVPTLTVRCCLDFALKQITDGENGQLAGTYTAEGQTFTLTQVENDANLYWWWGQQDAEYFGNRFNRSHFPPRQMGAIAHLGLAHLRGDLNEASGTELDRLEYAVNNVWENYESGFLSTLFGNPAFQTWTTTLARIAPMAMFLDKRHATPGNNKYATFINSGYWFNAIDRLNDHVNENTVPLFPAFAYPSTDNRSDELDHQEGYWSSVAMTYKEGYNPGGLLTVSFFDKLAARFNTHQWPSGNTDPYYHWDQTGSTDFLSLWSLLAANNATLKSRLEAWYTAGNDGNRRPDADISFYAGLLLADDGPLGF